MQVKEKKINKESRKEVKEKIQRRYTDKKIIIITERAEKN